MAHWKNKLSLLTFSLFINIFMSLLFNFYFIFTYSPGLCIACTCARLSCALKGQLKTEVCCLEGICRIDYPICFKASYEVELCGGCEIILQILKIAKIRSLRWINSSNFINLKILGLQKNLTPETNPRSSKCESLFFNGNTRRYFATLPINYRAL